MHLCYSKNAAIISSVQIGSWS